MSDQDRFDADPEFLIGQACLALEILSTGRRELFEPASDLEKREGYYAMAAKLEYLRDGTPGFWKRPISEWYDDENVALVIGHAERGDADAQDALTSMTAMFEGSNLPSPPRLASYDRLVHIQKRAKQKRGAPVLYDLRDMVIAAAVAWLQRLGIPPTRNAEFRGCMPPTSGCSLVAVAVRREFAIDISDTYVEQLWRRRSERRTAALLELGKPSADMVESLVERNRNALKRLRKIVRHNC